MESEKRKPVHPGEVLPEEFPRPLGLSQNRLAIEISVPTRRINEIVLKKQRGVGCPLDTRGKLLSDRAGSRLGIRYADAPWRLTQSMHAEALQIGRLTP
jgi:addiction module HigA family antidote